MKAFTRSARANRIGSGVTLVGVSIALLAGCSPSTPAATPAPTVTVTVTPTPSPTPTPTATATGSAASPDASPVDIPCTSLVFDSTITAYSPTFELEASFIPMPDNSFGEIGGPLEGTLCSWKDSESGSTLGVGVAKPSAADLAKYEAEVAAKGTSSNAVADPSSGRGYVISGEAVETDLFTNSGYWIAVTSVIFDSPSSAKSIFANILETLPSG